MPNIQIPLVPPQDPFSSDATYQWMQAINTALTSVVGSVSPLGPPQAVTTEPRINAILVGWNQIPSASKYQIFESVFPLSNFNSSTLVGTVNQNVSGPTNSFLRSGLDDTKQRYYFVQAVSGAGVPGTPSVPSLDAPAYLDPVNANGSVESGLGLSQVSTTKQIAIATGTLQYAFGQVSYAAGTVTTGTYGQWYIYLIDRYYTGGTTTFYATQSVATMTSNPGVIYLGSITTTSGGGATGGGPGGGTGGKGGGGHGYNPN